MKLILGGHWTAAPAGWTEVKESEQDITKRLKWDDSSVDAIFTEHVIEHISFVQGIGFMKEAFRVLKPDGIFRAVAPMVDVFANANVEFPPAFISRYAAEQLPPYYGPEISALSSLGLSLQTDLNPFIIDFLVRKHGHQFCWSRILMREVLQKIGFSAVEIQCPGRSDFDRSTCLERRIRGTHAENLERDFGRGVVFDPESGVVEARK